MQYTTRGISKSLDKAIKAHAKAERKSVNRIVVEALEQKFGVNGKKPRIDLSGIAGTWVEDPAFDQAIKDFDRIDPEMWK